MSLFKKIVGIFFVSVILTSCAGFPAHRGGYVELKDGKKFDLDEGQVTVYNNEFITVHQKSCLIRVEKYDLKTIHLEYVENK
jgi:hypothetical protein